MEKIKKCPFCGSDAEYGCNRHLSHHVKCKDENCEATISLFRSEKLAVETWNKRI